MWLYAVSNSSKLHVFEVLGFAHTLAFAELPYFTLPGAPKKQRHFALAIGGDDRAVSVWECGKIARLDFDDASASGLQPDNFSNSSVYRQLMKLARPKDISVVTFSRDSLAIASGHQVTLVGTSGGLSSWRDRPDFEAMADLMEGDASSLSLMLERFPTATNIRHPCSGEAVLQRAVRLHTKDVLKTLLLSDTGIGLIHDRKSRTALLTALLLEQRESAAMILDVVKKGRVSTVASSLRAVTEVFPILAKKLPRLFLDLLCEMPLEKEPSILAPPTHALDDSYARPTFARLSDGETLVRGSEQRNGPQHLWSDLCDDATTHKAQSVEWDDNTAAEDPSQVENDPQRKLPSRNSVRYNKSAKVWRSISKGRTEGEKQVITITFR